MAERIKRLRQQIHQRSENFKLLHRFFDQEEKGLQSSDLFQLMMDLNMEITKEAFDIYMTQYTQPDGSMEPLDLMNAVLDSNESTDSNKAKEKENKESEDEEKLLVDIFSVFDREKNGAVEDTQFRETMLLLQIPLEDSLVLRMYKMFDLSGDNSIDYSEFSEGLKNRIGLKKVLI